MRSSIISIIVSALLLISNAGANNYSPLQSDEASLKTKLDEEFKWLREEAFDMKVVTASTKAQKISDAPATIIVITQEQIEAYGWRDLKDVFKAIPGVDVSYNVQGELKTSVTMRGVVGNQKILILQDGHKYSSESGEPFVYADNMPLNIYKRIEIIYGPASSIYGADAYAGVINLISKDGADYNGTQINAGYLSTGAYATDVSFGKKIDDNTDVLISARIFRGNDEKLHEDYAEYSAVNSYKGKLAALDNDYPIKDWNLFFKLHYQKFTIGFDWQHELESNAGVSLPSDYAYVSDFVWGQDLRHIYIDHETYSDKNLKITTSLSAGDYELNPATNFYIVSQDAQGNMTDGSPAYKYAYSSYFKGNTQVNWDISEKFSTITGLSYENVKSFPKTRNLTQPFNSDGPLQLDYSNFTDPKGYTFGILGFKQPIFGERNSENFGSFVQTEYKFSENVKFDAGIRYDYNSIYKGTFNPRIGMIIDPMKDLNIKLLYATAYIQPSDYYKYQNFANPFLMLIPNENLEPEKLKNYSVDVSYNFGEHYALQVAVFLNKMENIIRAVQAPTQASNYPYYNPYRTTPGYVEYYGNEGDIESKGCEITLKHKIDQLSSSLSYSYVTGDDDGFAIAGISHHKITLNSSYTAEKWTAALTLRYYSDVSTDKNNYQYGSPNAGGDGSYEFGGAFIAYLNFVYRFNKSLSANLSVDNVFDTKSYGSVPFDGSPVVVPRAPQPLRQTFLGIRYSF